MWATDALSPTTDDGTVSCTGTRALQPSRSPDTRTVQRRLASEGGSIMTQESDGLWPHDPEALDDNRVVDDLEIPADEELLPNAEDIAPTDVETTDEWGDDADNRLVDLGDDIDDDESVDR
ncbi:hypothetical protein B7495_13975 [Cryobacterium sp. LW097]|nr:hypothetical protein B7495_13975 [Cryobacterium sp. LW097]